MNAYIKALSADNLPVDGEEVLDANQRALEKVYLGLRQKQGINLKSFEAEIGVTFFEKYQKPLSKFFDFNFKSDVVAGSRKLSGRFLEIENGFFEFDQGRCVIIGFNLC